MDTWTHGHTDTRTDGQIESFESLLILKIQSKLGSKTLLRINTTGRRKYQKINTVQFRTNTVIMIPFLIVRTGMFMKNTVIFNVCVWKFKIFLGSVKSNYREQIFIFLKKNYLHGIWQMR